MEINKEKVVLGIIGGVVAGFMFGIGYILAERIMKKKAVASTVTAPASVSVSEGTTSSADGGDYRPQRTTSNQNQQRPQQRPQMSHPNNMTMPNYMQFDGGLPKRKSSLADIDFTTGTGTNW